MESYSEDTANAAAPAKRRRKVSTPAGLESQANESDSTRTPGSSVLALPAPTTPACSDTSGGGAVAASVDLTEYDEAMRKVIIAQQDLAKQKGRNFSSKSLTNLRVQNFWVDHAKGHALSGVGCFLKCQLDVFSFQTSVVNHVKISNQQ